MTWEQRAAGAGELATRLGQPEVDARLLELLLDVEDTAVSQATSDPLLARRDVAGLGLYVEAFGLAEEDTRNKLGDCLYDEDGTTWAFVRRLLRFPRFLPTLGLSFDRGRPQWTSTWPRRSVTTAGRCRIRLRGVCR